MDNYDNPDLWGITVGILSFLTAILYSYYLFQKYDLNRKPILNLLLISAVGHFAGAVAFYYFAIKIGADSIFYFQNATLELKGFGYWFAFFILGYLKAYLVGDSFIGSFLISGAIGLIGSVYYLMTYKILLDKISDKHPYYLHDAKQLFYPAMLLLCWPSYFFWSSGLVKDNFSFVSIGMMLFVIAQKKFSISSLMTFGIAFFMGFMVRPYLFIIFIFSGGIYVLLGSQWKPQVKISVLVVLVFLTILLLPALKSYSMLAHFSGVSLTDVGEYAVRQQKFMNIGSTIPIPTDNPHLTFLFIPYLVLANLFLPLGIGANNFIGLISSIENAYLLFWAILFIKNKAVWNMLKSKLTISKFFLIYTTIGMSCLSIMNSNLGLAMREKMMYVPAMLICIFLTYAYKRVLAIKSMQEIDAFDAK